MHLDADESERISELMRGLATPARIRILARLLDGPATVTELTEELELSQAAASNHLRILRHLNMAVGDRQGRNVTYRLHDEHVGSMVEQILVHARHT